MSIISLPEAVREDLTLRRDLHPDDVRGFLGDLWREPDGHDAGLVFADWLEDQGDARTQPVRWSILRENVYTETVREAYRQRMTDWWQRHGRAWVGPVPSHLPLVWERGCLGTTVPVFAGRDRAGPAGAVQVIRTLRQAPWIGRLELDVLNTTTPFYELGPNIQALCLRRCFTADLAALERAATLRHLSLRSYALQRADVRRLPSLQIAEIVEAKNLLSLLLEDLPELVRFEPMDCPLVHELRIERVPKLTSLSLAQLPLLRRLDLIDLPALERLDVPADLAQLNVRSCPRLPRHEVAAIVARCRR
jgi:uncharacterized protein (TIGR02996 family)